MDKKHLDIFQNIFFCVQKKKSNSYRFGMTWVWINDCISFHFQRCLVKKLKRKSTNVLQWLMSVIKWETAEVLHQWTSSKPNISFHVAQASLPWWTSSWVSLQLLPANWHQSCIASTNYCSMQFLLLFFSTQADVLRRLHAHTSVLSPVAKHHVNPPNPSSQSQLIVNSPGLGAFDCFVAWQQLPWKPFFKGGLGQKKETGKGCWRGKRR